LANGHFRLDSDYARAVELIAQPCAQPDWPIRAG